MGLRAEIKQKVLNNFESQIKEELDKEFNDNFCVEANIYTIHQKISGLYKATIDLKIKCSDDGYSKLKSTIKSDRNRFHFSNDKNLCRQIARLFITKSGFYFKFDLKEEEFIGQVAELVYTNPRTFLNKDFHFIKGYEEYGERTADILKVMLELANEGVSVKLNDLFYTQRYNEAAAQRYENLADQIVRCFNEEYDKTTEGKREKQAAEEAKNVQTEQQKKKERLLKKSREKINGMAKKFKQPGDEE